MFSFKRDAIVYLEYGLVRYRLDISEINFSQNIRKETNSSKTIQNQEMFPGIKAVDFDNATFSLTIPALRESDLTIIVDKAIEVGTFSLYISTEGDVFKLANCVITNATFVIEKTRPLGVSFQGEASLLTREGDPWSYSYNSNLRARSTGRTYNRVTQVAVSLAGRPVYSIHGLSIELQNNIEWVKDTTLDSICESSSRVLRGPADFTVQDRVLSGSVTTYQTFVEKYSESTPLFIQVGELVGDIVYGFEFNLNEVAYTSRMTTGQIFTTSYDWRLVENPENLSELIKYIVDYDDEPTSILDYYGESIFDSSGIPVLDST